MYDCYIIGIHVAGENSCNKNFPWLPKGNYQLQEFSPAVGMIPATSISLVTLL
jgi:hypothetical protein